jgi:hypothetical protein
LEAKHSTIERLEAKHSTIEGLETKHPKPKRQSGCRFHGNPCLVSAGSSFERGTVGYS